MEKVVGAFEARQSLGKLIEEAYYKKDSIIIERSGRPMAVLISIDNYQEWQRLARQQVMTMIDSVHKRTAKVSSAELDADAKTALKQLRQENRRRKNARV